MTGDSLKEFVVKFYGPKETPYEGGVWRIKVELPDKYPFKSPRLGSELSEKYQLFVVLAS